MSFKINSYASHEKFNSEKKINDYVFYKQYKYN